MGSGPGRMGARLDRARAGCIGTGVAATLALLLAAGLQPAVAQGAGVFLVADGQAFPGHGGGVIRIYDDGMRMTVSSNDTAGGDPFADPVGIAVDPSTGRIFVSDRNAFGGTGGIFAVDPNTGRRTTISQNAAPAGGTLFEDPRGIEFDPATGNLFVADPSARGRKGVIFSIDPATGQRVELISTYPAAFDDPVDLVLGPDGPLYVADRGAFAGNGAIWRVDISTGQLTLVSQNSNPAGGPSFADPFGIDVNSMTGGLLVPDPEAFGGNGGVIGVDRMNGQRTTLSENGFPAGEPNFMDPFGVTYDRVSGRFVIVDKSAFGGAGGLIAVDASTGARSTFSSNMLPGGLPNFVDPFAVAVEPNPPPFEPDPIAAGFCRNVAHVEFSGADLELLRKFFCLEGSVNQNIGLVAAILLDQVDRKNPGRGSVSRRRALRRVRVGRLEASVKQGERKGDVEITLNRRGRAALKHKGRLRIEAIGTVTSPDSDEGDPFEDKLTLVLRD